MLQLRIELLGPLACGSGVNRPGISDREVTFDGDNLPIIPGRRLKGLLRDVYGQLEGNAQLADFGLSSGRNLLGAIGDTAAAAVKIGNAHLDEGGEVASWLRSLGGDSPILPEDVRGHYTEIRRQTSISRKTGAPLKNTLRQTRVLKAGLQFSARVGGRLSRQQKLSLGLAACGVQQMGTGRSRGLGKVTCKVVEGGTDWSREALDLLHQPNGRIERVDEGSALATVRAGGAVSPAVPSYRAVFSVELRAPALLPSMEGDPNTVVTEQYLPGSTIQGLLSAAYRSSVEYDDAEFHRLFTSGRVMFLNAYPAIDAEKRSCPIPLSVRQYKLSDLWVDLAREPQDPDDTPKRRPGWVDLEQLVVGDTAARVEVALQTAYHHQRAGDPRIGRALGTEAKARERFRIGRGEAGTLFTYEALEAGQPFFGAILGSESDLMRLLDILPDDSNVQVGRSRSAEYGGNGRWRWNWSDLQEGIAAIAQDESETSSWSPIGDRQATNTVVVTLLSPLIGANDNGHPAPVFPLAELESALDCSVRREIARYVRVEWHAGFLSHQRLPKQQMPALARGSVFVYKLSQEVDGAARHRAETISYGLRQECGYGRVSIRPRDAARINGCADPQRPTPDGKSFRGAPPRLGLAILKQRLAETVSMIALKLAADSRKAGTEGVERKVTPHAIHRLLSLIAADDPWRELGRMRETAVAPLRRCFVREEGRVTTTLYDFLQSVWRERETRYGDLVDAVFRQSRWPAVFKANPLLTEGPEFQETIVRMFLRRYLQALALRLRKLDEPEEKRK